MIQVLVTDTLFIFPEHEKRLREAGLEIVRLAKPEPSEAELVEAIRGKDAYILGGIEKVTAPVIAAADRLKMIALAGTVWKFFIPAWQEATSKGITITNAPHANAGAVSEWVLAAGLAMARDLFAMGRTGQASFETTAGLDELHVGIVGLGHVGMRIAGLFKAIGVRQISYWNRTPKNAPFERQELDALLKTADLICVCVSKDAGERFVDTRKLSLLKNGAIITCLDDEVMDDDALLAELRAGRIRAFLDRTMTPAFAELPLRVFYNSNETTAYNTRSANKLASDMVTESVINILSGRDDPRIVNRS
jgi:phosphoglycerate dehydrogenase-like enzyme